MERGFQAMLLRGEGSDGVSPSAFIGQTTGEAYVNSLYSAMNAQSFPSVQDEKYLPHSRDYSIGTFPVATSVDLPAFGYLGEDFPVNQSLEVNETLGNRDSKLKMPKYEPFDDEMVTIEPIDFISRSPGSVSDMRFRQLPDLRSLEQVHDGFAFAESPGKRAKSFSPPATDSRTIESLVRNFQLSNYFAGVKLPEIQPPAVVPASALARQRRQRISDKTRCLQKLLPWDKKMDMATMLEEAYKYVKFLQAQISVLQSMPNDSLSFASQNPSNYNLYGGLGRLNRQQLLQILVNSPVVQTTLYSKACCVYSIEQLVLLKKIAERKSLFQQMLYHPSTMP